MIGYFYFHVQIMTERRRELRRSDARTDLDQLFNNAFHTYEMPMSREGMVTWFLEMVCFQRSLTIEQLTDISNVTRRFVGTLNENELDQSLNVYNKYINMLRNEWTPSFALNLEGFHIWEEWHEIQQTDG